MINNIRNGNINSQSRLNDIGAYDKTNLTSTIEPVSFMNSKRNMEIRSRSRSKSNSLRKNGITNRSFEISPLKDYDNIVVQGSYENINTKSPKLFFDIEIIKDWLISLNIKDAENFDFYNTLTEEEMNMSRAIKKDSLINKIKSG